MSVKRIAITTSSFGNYSSAPIEALNNNGYEIVFNSTGRKLKEDEIVPLCKGCVGIVAGTEKYTEKVISGLTEGQLELSALKVLSRCGTGMDNVDFAAAKKYGVRVVNTTDAPTQAVAELTVSMILDLVRRVGMMDREIRSGQWNKRMGRLLNGKRVGIVGFGRIGRKVASLLGVFGVQLAYYDVSNSRSDSDLQHMPFDQLLAWADLITLHCSAPKEGEYLIGNEQLKLMREGAYLINTARGELVDEETLYEVLQTGKLAGAALDVYAQEPYQGPLKNLDNVILTPHIGSYALESRICMEMDAVENLLRELGEING